MRRGSSVVSRLSPYAVPAALLLVALPFVCLVFYAVPACDDFCKAALAFNGQKQSSLFDFVRLYYWGWSARWFTTLLQGLLLHGSRMLVTYPYLLLMVILSQVAALGYFFSVALRLSRRTALVVGFLFYVVWLVTLESPAENIYWFTGASEYTFSITSMALVAGLLLSRGGLWADVVSCVMSFLIPAQHEMAGAFMCVFLLAGVVVARTSGLPIRRWVLCLAAALLGLAIVMGSPAAHARAVQENWHTWDFVHARRYLGRAGRKGVEWILNPTALLAACYACLLVGWSGTEERPARISSSAWASLCLLGMGVVLMEFAGSELAAGFSLPARAIGWLHGLFWLFLFLLVLAGRRTLAPLGRSMGVRWGLISLLVLALMGSRNFRFAVHDAVGPARAWRKASIQRLQTRGEDVRWEPLPLKPRLFMDPALSSDPSWWTNQCTANFLGLRSVVVDSTR